MEINTKQIHLGEEELPSLIQAITENGVAGFDQQTTSLSQTEGASKVNEEDQSKPTRTNSISISMPPSPVGARSSTTKSVQFTGDDHHTSIEVDQLHKQTKFYSQPMPKDRNFHNQRHVPSIDRRFDSFKTWSGQLERQLSNLRGKHHDHSTDHGSHEFESLPAHRYFDALQGPELDTLRDTEESILPEDKKWPFLLRFPVTSFGICLGVSSQSIMWKAISASPSTSYLHVSPDVNLILWAVSVVLFSIIIFIYSLKFILFFEAVRREYYHPVRVNFFFAPMIIVLLLALGLPPAVAKSLHSSLWYVFMAPILCLEVKIYGQWMSGGQRRLSKVANPSNHLAIVGNFVGALLGASMGLREGPVFFFAVGLAHYVVLFVTLYQRLPTNVTLPKELHPVFFLFVAAPSVASVAWATIQGSFDFGSRIPYFIALFLYISLAVRVNFFRGFRFSLAWWAYTFPMTAAATATIKYANEVTTPATRTLTLILCIVSTLTVAAVLVTTMIHAFVLRDLFPNDIAIAIAERRPKTTRKKWYHMRSGSSDSNIEQYLKYTTNSDEKDVESSLSSKNSQDSSVSLGS